MGTFGNLHGTMEVVPRLFDLLPDIGEVDLGVETFADFPSVVIVRLQKWALSLFEVRFIVITVKQHEVAPWLANRLALCFPAQGELSLGLCNFFILNLPVVFRLFNQEYVPSSDQSLPILFVKLLALHVFGAMFQKEQLGVSWQ